MMPVDVDEVLPKSSVAHYTSDRAEQGGSTKDHQVIREVTLSH